MNTNWQPISTAPINKRFLAYVPINNHRLVIAIKTDMDLILDENLKPMTYMPTLWHELPEKPIDL